MSLKNPESTYTPTPDEVAALIAHCPRNKRGVSHYNYEDLRPAHWRSWRSLLSHWGLPQTNDAWYESLK